MASKTASWFSFCVTEVYNTSIIFSFCFDKFHVQLVHLIHVIKIQLHSSPLTIQ
jgi:hypothetical protein